MSWKRDTASLFEVVKKHSRETVFYSQGGVREESLYVFLIVWVMRPVATGGSSVFGMRVDSMQQMPGFDSLILHVKYAIKVENLARVD